MSNLLLNQMQANENSKMMPHQSQGPRIALEDAAAFGILFNKDYFKGNLKDSLAVYEKDRLPRATKVQASAAKAAYNINERIGKPKSLH
jgi:salicylate hydroxylase